jgi:hypothetical protein
MRNRRTRGALQPELCDLCGRAADQQSMVVAEVEGLRERLICPWHRMSLVTSPSYNDLRRDGGDVLPFDDVSRTEPVGAELTLWQVSED